MCHGYRDSRPSFIDRIITAMLAFYSHDIPQNCNVSHSLPRAQMRFTHEDIQLTI